MSTSKRKKAGQTALAACVEALRGIHMAMAEVGKEIQPGTREYEKRLLEIATMLSEEELKGLINA